MKKVPRRLAILGSAGLVLLAGLSYGLYWVLSLRQVTISVVHEIRNDEVARSVADEIGRYEELTPRIQVVFREAQAADGGDLLILSRFPESPTRFAGTPVAWSGRLWTLAVHRDALTLLGREVPDQADALVSGDLDLDGFETLLDTLHENAVIPIALGNSHGWPYLLWMQFAVASAHGRSAAQQFPEPGPDPEDPISLIRDRLSSWRERKWFNPDTFDRGWVTGLEPIANGTAAFAIMNDTQLTAIPPALRRNLVFLPFPGSVQSESWLIGSVHFLAIPETSRNKRAATALRDHLSSAEVTARLSGSTGRPFFSWAVYDGAPPEVLDAWISRANTPELNALARWAVE